MTRSTPRAFLFGLVLCLAAGIAPSAGHAADPARPYVGMQVHGMAPEISDALGINRPSAALVRDVDLDGPAARAGFRRGDVLVSLNGKGLDSFDDLITAFGGLKPGTDVLVGVWRKGRTQELGLTVATYPEARNITKGAAGTLPHLGLGLVTITEKERENFNLEWAITGVLVAHAGADNNRTADVARGDVIILVNQDPVWTPVQVLDAFAMAAQTGHDRVLVLVRGPAGYRYVLLPTR